MKYLKHINEFFSTKNPWTSPEDIEKVKSNELNKSIKYFESRLSDLIKTGHYDKPEDLETPFSDIKRILERDCSEFIRELKSSGSLLFRGIMSLRNGPVVEDDNTISGLWLKEARKSRYTVDMDPDISYVFDDKFKELFDVKLRSEGVFATKNPITASDYSSFTGENRYKKAYLFFPIGSYRYFWNPKIYDLFSDIENERWYYTYQNNDLTYEYNDIYGDPRRNTWLQSIGYNKDSKGHFRLFGKDIPDMPFKDIVKYITDNHKEFGLEDNGIKSKDDIKCYNKDGKVVICTNMSLANVSSLEWVPNISYDQFLKENEEDPDKEIDRIVNGYVESNLEKAKDQEITFKVDKYYVIDEEYYFMIKDWLFPERK